MARAGVAVVSRNSSSNGIACASEPHAGVPVMPSRARPSPRSSCPTGPSGTGLQQKTAIDISLVFQYHWYRERLTAQEVQRIATRRLTRAESKALTRERLLEAARVVFLQRGFHATTVDQIAEEAGFTKGAVYSAFDSKADMFLALYEERVARRADAYLRSAEGLGADEQARAAVAEWVEVLRRDRDWSLVLIEFWTHAARDDKLRERFSRLHATLRHSLAEAFEGAAERSGRRLVASSELLATASMALANGFVLEGFAEPEVVSRGAFAQVAMLLGSAFGLLEGDDGGGPLPRSDEQASAADVVRPAHRERRKR